MAHLIGFIFSGFIVGLIARARKPGNDRMSFGMTSILGMAGAILAGWVGQQAGWYADGDGVGFFVSTVGAALLLAPFYGMTRRDPA